MTAMLAVHAYLRLFHVDVHGTVCPLRDNRMNKNPSKK